MWLFEKGAFGAVLVVMSLAASLLFGVIINVNSETVEKNVPEYVSDIRGLYEGESDQTYVDYNPAANFNGYSFGGSVFTYPNSSTRTTQTVAPHVQGSTYIEYGRVPLYADKDWYYITTTNTTTLFHTTGTITGTAFGPFVRASATSWVWGAITVDTSNFRIAGNAETIYTVNHNMASALPSPYGLGSNAYFDYTIPANSVVKIISEGTTHYIPILSQTLLHLESDVVTVNGNSYNITADNTYDVFVASTESSLSYVSVNVYEDEQYSYAWFGYRTIGSLSGSFTASDITSLVGNAEVSDNKDYGGITLSGNVTATDGTNTYVGPRTFHRGPTGWIGDIGRMEDFTYTAPPSDTQVTAYEYEQVMTTAYNLGGRHIIDLQTTTPFSIMNKTGPDSSNLTKSYLYAEPQNGVITLSTENYMEFWINGTKAMDLDVYSRTYICPATIASYTYDQTTFMNRTATLDSYSTSTRQGYPLNEHTISYGNGIPDDQQYGFYKIEASATATLTDESGTISARTFGAFYAYSDTTWKWATRTASTTVFSITGSATTEYTVTSVGFTQIVIPYEYDMTVPSGNTVIKINSGGANTYLHLTNAFHIIFNGTMYTINGNNYSNVDALYISTFDSVTLNYTATIRDYPVEFTPSSTANNYKFSYDTTYSVTRDVDISTYRDAGESITSWAYSYSGTSNIYTGGSVEDYTGSFEGWVSIFKRVPLREIIEQERQYAELQLSSVKEIVIDFPATVIKDSVTTEVYSSGNTHYTWTVAYDILDNPIGIVPNIQTMYNTFPYTATNLYDNYNSGDIIHQGCVYNIETGLGSIYYGADTNATIYTFDLNSIDSFSVFYPYDTISESSEGPQFCLKRYLTITDHTGSHRYDLPLTSINCRNTMNVTYTSDETYSYLDARFGVNVRNGEQITWQNAYRNEVVEYIAMLGVPDSNGIVMPDLSKTYDTTWEFTYGEGQPSQTAIGSRSSIRLVHEANGPTTFYFDDYGSGGASYNAGGSWVAFVINVNGVTGKVTIAPIASANWTSFLVNTPEAPVGIDYALRNRGDITGILVSVPGDMSGGSYTYNPVRFQVANTKVFLNTYGVIKVDATLDILKYYPYNEKFMISIHDTAAVGSSITIAGVTCEVTDNIIRFPVTNSAGHLSYTPIDVSEMEISYYKQPNGLYDVNISSPKSGTDVDLTNISDTTIGLEGAWYFESDYYKIVLKNVQEYMWNVNSLAYGYSGIVLFMMVFLGIMSILFWKFKPEMMGIIDIAIIIGAEVILFIILV